MTYLVPRGSGSGVSVSIGGSIVAIGAMRADSPDDGIDGVGHVRIFSYRAKDDAWVQVEKTIYGYKKRFGHSLGHSLFLSVGGSRVAISAPMADAEMGEDS